MEQEPVRKKPGLLELLDEWEKQGASDAEITQRMNRYLDSKARKEGVPLHGTFELTPLCNLDCKMCYVHLSEKQLRESGKRLLTVDEWKDIMQQAIDAGMMTATLTGGECLTYPGFDELYLFLWEQGIKITVKTNGVLLTDKRIDFFKLYPPSGIQITLYGADNETYEEVAGIRVFDGVMSNIHNAMNAGFALEVNITPNKFMLADAEKMLKLLESLGVDYYINAALFESREETGRDGKSIDVTLEDYIDLYKLQAKLRNRAIKPIAREQIPSPATHGIPTMGVRCAAGKSYFAVFWNGCLHPCISIDKICVNLLETPFLQAWRTINHEVRRYPYPSECGSCVYRTLCPVCVVQHEYGGREGHANRFFCERVQKLIEAGIYVLR